MTATMNASSLASSQWVKVFPSQVTENYSSSVTYIKQMTVVAVSTITYLKNMLPEDSYKIENFEGITLRILKKKCRNELAQFLSEALTRAFDAFDKKYLGQLALCFYANEHTVENFIEYHIFEYSYHDDGITMNIHSKNGDSGNRSATYTFNNLREKTVHMIRACVVLMGSYQNEPPATNIICIRLYYNKNAPLSYQAPGYLSANGTEDPLDSTLDDAIKLGCVETPYHKLVARSYFRDIIMASREGIASQNPPSITQRETVSSNDMWGEASAKSGSQVPIRCPCNKYEGRELGPACYLVCQYCKTRQHATCFGVWRERPARHCCAACHGADAARAPTDGTLTALPARQRQSLCMYRRTLELCAHVSTIDVSELVDKLSISNANACKLMKLLNYEGIIKFNSEHDIASAHKVRVNGLKLAMGKYFQNMGEECAAIHPRDMAPIGENRSQSTSHGFSPRETNIEIDLRNPSKAEQVAVNILKKSTNEDLIVKQYRETMLAKKNAKEANGIRTLPKSVQTKGVKRKMRKNIKEYGLCLRSGVALKDARAM